MLTTNNPFTFIRASAANETNAAGVMANVGNHVLRSGYSSSTGAPLGWRIEGPATNAVLFSSGNGSQYASTATTNATWTQDGPLTPDGAGASWVLRPTVAGAVCRGVGYPQDASLSGVQVVFSAYVKPVNGQQKIDMSPWGQSTVGGGFSPSASFTLTGSGSTSAPSTSGISALGNGWYRIHATWTQLANNTGSSAFVIQSADAIDPTAGVAIWGIQVEAAAGYPTSLVSTSGAVASRIVDLLTINSLTSLLGSTLTQGTVIVEAQVPALSTAISQGIVALHDGTDSNRMGLFIGIGTSNIVLRNSIAGVANGVTLSGNVVAGSAFRAGFTFDSTSVRGSLNGGAVGTSPGTGFAPGINQAVIGRATSSGTAMLGGRIRLVRFYAYSMADAELQAATTPGV